MKKVLFICTGNAGRSQIAAALLRKSVGDGVEVLSAGVEPWDDLHPIARRLLEERGFDTAGLYPKHVNLFVDTPLDVVVTIGSRAGKEKPRLRGNPRRIHWEIGDPADADGTDYVEAVFSHTWKAIESRVPEVQHLVEATSDLNELHLAPGISTCVTRPDVFEPAKHLPLIAAAGYRCIELCCFLGSADFQWDSMKAVKELRKIADDCGLTIWALHAAGGLGCFRMGMTRTMAHDMLRVHADLAAEIGAMVVPMHAGPDTSLPMERGIHQLHSDLHALEAHVRGLPCRFGWENEPKGLTTDEHVGWLSSMDASAFCFVLDPGHANQAGTLDGYLDKGTALFGSLHINDNDGTADQHRMPGQGTIRWEGFAERLEALGYRGPLMLEILANDRQHELPAVLAEARQSLELLKES